MTITLSLRRLLMAMTVAIILSAAIGFSIASLAAPQTANATGANAASANSQIIDQLRQINHALGANYRSSSLIGYTADGFHDVGRELTEICRNTAEAAGHVGAGC